MFCAPNSFRAVPRASGPVFMFCAPELILGCIERAGSRFHVLCNETHFGWYRGCRVPFSFLALSDPFWAVPRAPGLAFMFCAPKLVSAILRALVLVFMFCAPGPVTRFKQNRGRRVQSSCFALPNSFLRYRGRRNPIFMFFCYRTHFRGF
jgi:hypothetical protein